MVSIVILGSGNVAFHLINNFKNNENVFLKQVYARNKDMVSFLNEKVDVTDNLSDLVVADVYIVAVSDQAISAVVSLLPVKKSLVVHVSGATSIDILSRFDRRGVFYMLHSFSKNKAVDFNQVPFCLEANNKNDLNLLSELANSLSGRVYYLDSLQRSQLHVAAVFANNFTNYMFTIAYQLCDSSDIDFGLLHAMIKNTADKVTKMSPLESQTGPAIRNDTETIEQHLKLLDEDQKIIYKQITKSIQDEYKL